MSVTQKRILLVDDDPDLSAAMKLLLNMADFDVTQSNTFGQALEQAESEQFDLFILDSHLYDQSGVDLCARIRSFNRITPIVFCSGDARQADKDKGLQAGAQAYMTKPVDFDDLIRVVRRLAPANPQ